MVLSGKLPTQMNCMNEDQVRGLLTLRHLTRLDLYISDYSYRQFDFLSHLPELSSLRIEISYFCSDSNKSIFSDVVLASAPLCTLLTQIHLSNVTFTNDQLKKFLSYCTSLSDLTLLMPRNLSSMAPFTQLRHQ